MKNGFKTLMETIPVPNDNTMEALIDIVHEQRVHVHLRSTIYEFVYSQCFFLKSYLWMWQIACLLIGFFLTYLCMQYEKVALMRFIISLIPIMFHMLSIPLLLKSVDNETIELENVTYFRYVHVIVARIIWIGFCNLICISVLMLVTSGIAHLSFEQLLVYAVVPFNITCILSFLVMYFIQHDQCIIVSIVLNVLFSVFLFLLSNTQIYMATTYLWIWRILLPVSILWLLGCGYALIRQAQDCNHMQYEERKFLWS